MRLIERTIKYEMMRFFQLGMGILIVSNLLNEIAALKFS